MSDIQNVDFNTLGLKPEPVKKNNELDQDAFWKLLTAQMQNQDPLEP